MSGILYVVATPIGNLEDITLRAVRTLREVSLIAAEDTRHTKKLLNHLGIQATLESYHEHNEAKKSDKLVRILESGKNIALVSDAGTPVVSDPGVRLVSKALEKGIKVSPIPGASAAIATLSVAGLRADEFTFLGFIPERSTLRENFFTKIRSTPSTYILYESPARLLKSLEVMATFIPNSKVVVGRELTKIHEELLSGTPEEILKTLKDRKIKGEITIVLYLEKEDLSVEDGLNLLQSLLDEKLPLKEAARIVAKETGLSKSEIYKEGLRIKKNI
ncbi:MAG: 16S rRNA (cytidine(1402)-2'-O)-methyltransferase [Deltaproteobacteria bacterium]|nr:16S rRNA (cytidine(1402)-2'-O)-methyltransferase [Deltaproteobacteria bacterium]